jgi:iron(III) transport system permease protein
LKARRSYTQPAIFGGAIVLLIILVGLPLGLLFVKSFVRDGAFTFDNYVRVFSEQRNVLPFWNTLKLGVLTVALSSAVGVILAWLVARTDLPGRRLVGLACLVPYMLPPFIGAMAWTQLLAPRVGYINKLWMAITHTSDSLVNLYSFGGIVWVMAMYTFPFIFITVSGALQRMNPSLEEAARIAGSGKLRVLRDVTLPLVLPSIMAGMILAFLYTISNFGVPALIGMRARIFVLTTRIYAYINQGTFDAIRLAISLSVLLLVAAVFILLLNRWVIRRQHGAAIISGKSVRPTIVTLGRWRVPIAVAVYAFLGFIVIAPLISLILTSFVKAWGLPLRWENLSIRNYVYILFEYSLTRKAILNSLMLALVAATACTLLGAVLSYITVKTRLRGRHALDYLSTLPHAIPGTVVALAMILAWSGQFKVNLYNTFWIIIVAYITRYLFYSFRNISASLSQIHPSLEEAARVSGASWSQNFRDVVVPLMRPGLVASWLLVFMPALRELTLSILLYGPRTPTLAVAVFELQDAGYYHIAAAMASLIVVVLLVLNVFARRILRGRSNVF